jgi:outer membrane protein, heavy metal efflux system
VNPRRVDHACLRILLCGVVAAGSAACGPSRADLFDPVSHAVRERTGIAPEWRFEEHRAAATAKGSGVAGLLAQPLTATSAAAIAVLNNPELQASYAELAAAGGALTAARSVSNPELEAELTFPLEGDDRPHIELSALQDLTQLIAMIPAGRAADAGLRAARKRAILRTVELAARAQVAFYRAVAAAQRAAQRRVIADAAGASAEFARGLHAAGNIPEFDRLRETVFEEEAQIAVAEAELEATSSREALGSVLGLQGDGPTWTLTSELPSAPERPSGLLDLERDALAASLELQALRAEIEGAGENIALARMQSWLPHLAAGVSVKREDEWSVGPAVALSLPLFDWGQGKRETAHARLSAAQHRYAAVEIATRAAARAAAARAVAAHQRVTRMQTRVLPLRKQLLAQAVRRYNAMTLDVFQLLVLRREQATSEERHIDALRDYFIAQSDIEQLRGGALPLRAEDGSGAAASGSGATESPSGGH